MLPVTIGLGVINFDLFINSIARVAGLRPGAARDRRRVPHLHAAPGRLLGRPRDRALPDPQPVRRPRGPSTACASTTGQRHPPDRPAARPGRRVHARARDPDHAAHLPARRSSAPSRPSSSRSALFWFSFSLPFAGVNLLLTRTFFSLQRPWMPTFIARGEPRRQRRGQPRRSTSRSASPDSSSAPSCRAWSARSAQAYFLRPLLGGSSRAAARSTVRRGSASHRRCWPSSPTACGRRSTASSGGSIVAQILSVGLAGAAGAAAYAGAVLWTGASPRPARSAPARPAARPLTSALVWISVPMADQAAHPQLLDHRPHRPRQVDAGRPHPRAHAHRRRAADARAGARLHGPRARARDHDQGAGRPRALHGPRRRDLPAAPHRHARPRRLHLRGLAVARGLRGRAPGRRRVAGRRGADRSPTPTSPSTPGSS